MCIKNSNRLAVLTVIIAFLGCKQRQTNVTGYSDHRDFAISDTPADKAKWSAKITLPIVPGAASHLPDGRIMFWSAADRVNFIPGKGKTQVVFFDPKTGVSTAKEVFETDHDMFCPGTTNLMNGQILINGGKNSDRTTIFDSFSNQWKISDVMRIARGYQANTILPNGSVFTFGGSWSGEIEKSKDAEVWNEGKWRTLRNVRMDPNFYSDYSAIKEFDNHLWLQPMSNGRILHTGPGPRMHWIDTDGDGDVEYIAQRGDDESSLNGLAVMYDIDRILKVGGARHYGSMAPASVDASNSAYSIELSGNGKITTTKLAPMKYRRTFANGVVLPGGQVLITGGQTRPKLFSDDNGVLISEIWDPKSRTFSTLPPPPEAIARTYHSIGLLLPDARVIVGGGGMIGNPAIDHLDLQILSPPYLYTMSGQPAIRPEILMAPKEAANGQMIQVAGSPKIAAFDLIRMSSVTHSINNDQRRIPVSFSIIGASKYQLTIPTNPSVALPGYYMLFAINEQGVPSTAQFIRINSPQESAPEPEVPDRYVWRFISYDSNAPNRASPLRYYYAVSATPSMPEIPAGFFVDPDAPSFIFQAWASSGQGRSPVYLCKDLAGQYSLQAESCNQGTSDNLLFFAYSVPRPATTKVLRYLHKANGANLHLPSTFRNRDQINEMDDIKGQTIWKAEVRRGPNREKGSFYARAVDPASNPDVFIWRFFAAPSQTIPNSRMNYTYVTTNNPYQPAPPPGFIGDPTATSYIFKAWTTGADGRVPVYLCQQLTSVRFWMGQNCLGDRTVKLLFFAYKEPRIDTAKVLHYTNNRWGGKLLLPDSPENNMQINGLDDTTGTETWTGWITRRESRLEPFYVSSNSCVRTGRCVGDIADLTIWRFYSKILPGRPNQRSDYYYMVTQGSKAPIPPDVYQPDPTSIGPIFRGWSSPGKGRIPVVLCQNPGSKRFWIGNGCAGDTQSAILFYAYNEEIAGSVRSLHYLSLRWNGKLILPNTPQLKTQIDALDAPSAGDPWLSFINRTTRTVLSPFWIMPSGR